SSRRRHTRFSRDWSSDVCSSDLILLAATATALAAQEGVSTMGHARTRHLADSGRLPEPRDVVVEDIVNYHRHRLPAPGAGSAVEIGRASCRAREDTRRVATSINE